MNLNMKPPTTSEYLSKEILEEDLIKVFSISNWLQKIMGVSRVDARDRFVTAPSIPQKIYTIIYCVVVICICYVGFSAYFSILNTRLYYLGLSCGMLVLLTFLCNAIHVRFLNKDDNVAFYIKMQEIDRIMDIHHCKPINTILYRMYFFTLLSLFGLAILIFIITLFTRTVLVLGFLTLVFSYGGFIHELAYCSNLIVYFYLRVRFVNAIMDNHIQAQFIKIYATPNYNIKSLALQSRNFLTSDTDIYLERIFECFLKYQDLYRFQVVILFFGFIIFWGLSAQSAIDGIQTNLIGLLEWIVVSVMLLVGFLLVVFLCLRLQILYMDIKETKRLCIRVMSMHSDGPAREKAKKMYKAIQENAPRFSVYDMWYMEASIVPRILGLMTNLLVTLLQFAYL